MKRLAYLMFLFALPGWSTTYYVTVAGLGGEASYEQRFRSWAQEIDKLLKSSPEAKVETLFGPEATRSHVQSTLQQIAKASTPQDSVVVILIGHGTFDGSDYKLTLPGPDLSAVDLAGLLDRVPSSHQLVVNTTSASGGSLAVLRKTNRGVISATKSGNEKNATNFARYWVEALRDPAADTDKNEVVTALEAFRYADQKTKEFYEQQKRIATEHAVLEDGQTAGATNKPSAENGQGLLAARFALFRMGPLQAAAKDPEKRKLLTRREELERRIEELTYKKASMPDAQYRQMMTEALLELSKVQAEIDK